MQFKMLDRLMLASILPGHGNFLTMSTVMELKDRLAITKEEREDKKLNLHSTKDGGVAWEAEADIGVEIVLTKSETDMIKKALKELEDTQKLTADHLSLYRTFQIEE